MLVAGKSKIKGIRFGEQKIVRVMSGCQIVWANSDPFLSVSPDILWLLSDNGSADSFVNSNTSWNAEVSPEQN